jgi:polar amino acid transport system permease protein
LDFDLALLTTGPYHAQLVAGFWLSLKLAVGTLVLALPLALVVAVLRLTPSRLLSGIGFAFVEAIRNVPLLAHILFWYFGAPELVPAGIKQWLYRGNVEIAAAMIALTLYTAAYMSEDIRSGVRSVPREQLEAARALGFGFFTSMRLVVLPQALRITVAPLISQMLSLWKNTSMAMVVGVAELLYQAQQVESATFRAFESFAFATASYLGVSLIITGLAVWYEHRHRGTLRH